MFNVKSKMFNKLLYVRFTKAFIVIKVVFISSLSELSVHLSKELARKHFPLLNKNPNICTALLYL